MTSQWCHRNKTYSWYLELNSLQNAYFGIFIFEKLAEWRCFVTYLWNDSRIIIQKFKKIRPILLYITNIQLHTCFQLALKSLTLVQCRIVQHFFRWLHVFYKCYNFLCYRHLTKCSVVASVSAIYFAIFKTSFGHTCSVHKSYSGWGKKIGL